MTDVKQHLGVVIVGHVDAGKSTTTGRLLYELGYFNERQMAKARQIAKENNKDSFALAYLMDKGKVSRSKGITIDYATKEFATSKFHYSIIDCPGHKDFIKNMIVGASQADVALLMIPANKGGFESSIAKGSQTRQHAKLCYLLGIDQMIVAVNKMDDKSVNFDENRFNEIKQEMVKILTKIGYKSKKIAFVPISGFKGDNLTKPSENMSWYKGWSITMTKKVGDKGGKEKLKIKGITLLDALDNAIQPPKRDADKPLCMPVSNIYKVSGVGDIVAGRIEQGTVRPGMSVRFHPNNIVGKIFSIETHHREVEMAQAGDNVGLCIRGLGKQNLIPKSGDIMGTDSDKLFLNAVELFSAMVFVQDHPGKLKCGFTPLVHVRTSKCPCKMTKIKWKYGKSTGNTKVEAKDGLSVDYVEAGDQAEVVFVPSKPFIVEAFEICKPLGRIAAMDSNSLVMMGKVVHVERK